MNTKQRLTRWILLGTTLAVTGLLPALVSADEGMPRRPRMGAGQGAAGERMVEKLNLTEVQQEKLRDLRTDVRKQTVLDRGKMADLRAQLRVGFMEDQVNAGKVRSLNREINDLRAKMSERKLDQRLAMLEVLTPEQRETLMEMRQVRQGRGDRPGMRNGRGQRGGKGQGHGRMHGANQACDGQGPKCTGMARGRGKGNAACPLGKRGAGLGQGPGIGGDDDFGFLVDPRWWNDDEPMDGEVGDAEAGLPGSEGR